MCHIVTKEPANPFYTDAYLLHVSGSEHFFIHRHVKTAASVSHYIQIISTR
jgi:hypothetical protein